MILQQQLEVVHEFEIDLACANRDTPEEWLEAFYRAAFPGVREVWKVYDRDMQRDGIDTVVLLENGKSVYFDEKIRDKDYGDILLEEFSRWPDYPYLNGFMVGGYERPERWRGILVPGWLSQKKRTDYIAYIVKPARRAYFLPFLLLQRAWVNNYERWLAEYGRFAAANRGYHTTNIPVPVDVLYAAMAAEQEIAA